MGIELLKPVRSELLLLQSSGNPTRKTATESVRTGKTLSFYAVPRSGLVFQEVDLRLQGKPLGFAWTVDELTMRLYHSVFVYNNLAGAVVISYKGEDAISWRPA